MTENEEKLQLLRDTHRMTMEIRAVVLGVDGQGGHDRRISALEKYKSENETFIAKIVGAVFVIGSLASFLGAKVAAWIKIDPK